LTHLGDVRGAYKILVGRPDGRSHLEGQGVDRRKQVAGPSEGGNESSGCIKCGELIS
jgi:hypothetical protein